MEKESSFLNEDHLNCQLLTASLSFRAREDLGDYLTDALVANQQSWGSDS